LIATPLAFMVVSFVEIQLSMQKKRLKMLFISLFDIIDYKSLNILNEYPQSDLFRKGLRYSAEQE
jgi:hypothetical protein